MSTSIIVNDLFEPVNTDKAVLIDVRSEAEFEKGHIPGAVNMPLLNNSERVLIGTTYVKEGRNTAIEKGFEVAGHKFATFIKTTREIAGTKSLIIYCWRGGLRSRIVSWVLDLAGFKVSIVQGGYKSFRRLALQSFQTKRQIVILGGKTCSGKTELLEHLQKKGQRVIDLEFIANHKGSVFGGLGKPAQPSQEHFENRLFMQWRNVKDHEWLWLENESRLIGLLQIPDAVYNQMRNSPVVEISRLVDTRLQRVLNEYGSFDTEMLIQKTMKLQKRLGGLRLQRALEFLKSREIENWAMMMLDYYDNAYDHSNEQRNRELATIFNYNETVSAEENTELMIQALQQLIKRQLTDKNKYAEFPVNKL